MIPIAVIVIAGGILFFSKNIKKAVVKASPEPTSTTLAQTETIPLPTLQTSTTPDNSCKDFDAFKEAISQSIPKADNEKSENTVRFDWRRAPDEVLILYPGIKSHLFEYYAQSYKGEYEGPLNSDKNISLQNQKLAALAKNIFEKLDKNTKPSITNLGFVFYEEGSSKSLRPAEINDSHAAPNALFEYKKGQDLYTITQKSILSGHESTGDVTIELNCGYQKEQLEKLYDAIGVQKIMQPKNEVVGITDISPDGKYFIVSFMGGKDFRDSIYEFNGSSVSLAGAYSSDCKVLEEQKIGKGLPCEEIGADHFTTTKRTVNY